MKKNTTIKVSWDLQQEVNRLGFKLSDLKGSKVTQEQVIRYLLDFYEKNHPRLFKIKNSKGVGGTND